MRTLLVLLAVVALAFAAAPIRRLGADSVTCDICSWIVAGAEKQLASNATESEIIADLDKACSIFGPFASECESLVATYVPQVIQLLEQKVPALQICQQIGLCPVPTSTTAAASNQAVATSTHAAVTTTRSAAGVTGSSSSGQTQSSSGSQAASSGGSGSSGSGQSSGGSSGEAINWRNVKAPRRAK